MKSTIIAFILFLMVQFCQAAKDTILPEEPWRAIIEMNENGKYKRFWDDDILIKLRGNFSEEDSSMVEVAIKRLNELTSTIKLQMTSDDIGNLEIFFIDSTNRLKYKNLIFLSAKNSSTFLFQYKFSIPDSPGVIAFFKLALHLEIVPDSAKQYFITNQLAFALCPGWWDSRKGFKNGVYKGPVSIFMNAKPEGTYPYYSDLNRFDKEIIKTVYSSNFSELLPIAEKQFGKYEYSDWVRKYSHEILVFPFVIILFFLAGMIILIYKQLYMRFKSKLLLFNIVSIISLFFLGLTISFFFTSALTIKYQSSHFKPGNFIYGIFIFLLLGLPAINIIRLIEIAIHRNTQHKFYKILLLFLSTSLIPSLTLFFIVYFNFRSDLNNEGIQAMIIVFLVFVIIGIIRALISFFILKEKEIKIENEVKLANLRELKSKAELNALHSKINPHFLYNALNSIAGLAKTDAEKTEQMALSLSKLFRYSINKEQSDWSNFANEMEMVRIYLDIEKVRFEDRLDFIIDLPDELKPVKVPRFIIQSLVENAVKHGVSKLISKGRIAVSVVRNQKWIEITIADNGPDFPHELAPGFGLQSIYDKLEIMYPDKFEMHFINTPEKHILIKLA